MRKMMPIRIVGKYVWSVWKLWRGVWNVKDKEETYDG